MEEAGVCGNFASGMEMEVGIEEEVADVERFVGRADVEDFDNWRFLNVRASSDSMLVLSLLAGIVILSPRQYFRSGGGVLELAFWSSCMTAWRMEDMDAAGWKVDDMSWRAEARHSRYCILLFRSETFLMNARAATRAVAAVPAC